jgi:hypothetical protein
MVAAVATLLSAGDVVAGWLVKAEEEERRDDEVEDEVEDEVIVWVVTITKVVVGRLDGSTAVLGTVVAVVAVPLGAADTVG